MLTLCTNFIIRVCTPLTLCTILLSKGSSCNARVKKRRRAVLVVLPFVGVLASGSKYCLFTTKLAFRGNLNLQLKLRPLNIGLKSNIVAEVGNFYEV